MCNWRNLPLLYKFHYLDTGLESSHQTECLNGNGHGKSDVNRQFISERRNYSELQYILQRYAPIGREESIWRTLVTGKLLISLNLSHTRTERFFFKIIKRAMESDFSGRNEMLLSANILGKRVYAHLNFVNLMFILWYDIVKLTIRAVLPYKARQARAIVVVQSINASSIV